MDRLENLWASRFAISLSGQGHMSRLPPGQGHCSSLLLFVFKKETTVFVTTQLNFITLGMVWVVGIAIHFHDIKVQVTPGQGHFWGDFRLSATSSSDHAWTISWIYLKLGGLVGLQTALPVKVKSKGHLKVKVISAAFCLQIWAHTMLNRTMGYTWDLLVA